MFGLRILGQGEGISLSEKLQEQSEVIKIGFRNASKIRTDSYKRLGSGIRHQRTGKGLACQKSIRYPMEEVPRFQGTHKGLRKIPNRLMSQCVWK